MNRTIVILILGLLTQLDSSGQNLVPNPGFESIAYCPDGHLNSYQEFQMICSPWVSPTNLTPDVFSMCSTDPKTRLPNTQLSYQGTIYKSFNPPRSGTNSAMLAHGPYNYNIGDLIQIRLKKKLVSGKTYQVKYYYRPVSFSGYFINKLGFHLSNDSIRNHKFLDVDDPCFLQLCEIKEPSYLQTGKVLNDTANWNLLEANYTSTGEEEWLTIGSFSRVEKFDSTSDLPLWMLIDDVSIEYSHEISVSESSPCQGDSVTVFYDIASGTGFWSNVSNGQDTIVHFQQSGQFTISPIHKQTIYLFDQDGLLDSLVFQISEKLNYTLKPHYYKCLDSSLLVPLPIGNYSNPDFLINGTQVDSLIQIQEPGNFTLEVGGNLVCDTSISFEVIEPDPNLPSDDTTICLESKELELYLESGFSSAYWTFPFYSTNQFISVQTSSKVVQVLIDSFGCYHSKQTQVHDLCEGYAFIPTAFSPGNKDNLNDTFKVEAGYIEEFQMTIYNRWGQLVFESQSLETGWDGYFEGLPCEAGVYFCRISYRDKASGKSHVKSSTITLVR